MPKRLLKWWVKQNQESKNLQIIAKIKDEMLPLLTVRKIQFQRYNF